MTRNATVRRNSATGFLALFLVAGCAEPMRLESPLTSVDAPRTGDIARAETGSVILEQARYRVVEAISSDGDIEWGGGLFGVQTVLPAGFLVARRRDQRYTYYASVNGYLRLPGNKPGETEIVAVPDMELRVENDKLPVLNETALPNGSVVRLLTKPTLKRTIANFYDAAAYRRVLVYKGRARERWLFEYQAINGARAEPDVTQRVEYDSKDGNTVSYNGARIEIIDANDRAITYRVLSTFSN